MCSNLFVEKRHAYQLSKPNLDKESRLEVIYRILKEQLKKAKTDLLEIKKNRDKEAKIIEDTKIKMQ